MASIDFKTQFAGRILGNCTIEQRTPSRGWTQVNAKVLRGLPNTLRAALDTYSNKDTIIARARLRVISTNGHKTDILSNELRIHISEPPQHDQLAFEALRRANYRWSAFGSDYRQASYEHLTWLSSFLEQHRTSRYVPYLLVEYAAADSSHPQRAYETLMSVRTGFTRFPRHDVVLHWLGEVCRQLGSTTESQRYLDELDQHYPGSDFATANLKVKSRGVFRNR